MTPARFGSSRLPFLTRLRSLPDRCASLLLLLLLGFAGFPAAQAAPDAAESRGWLRTGKYSKAIDSAAEAVKENGRSEEWNLILGQGLLTVGRYAEARAALTNAVEENPRSLRLRWLAREACLSSGDTNLASQYLDTIRRLVSIQGGFSRDPANLVATARAALRWGVDPKVVLEKVLEPARKEDPDLVDTYLARGELALEKHDAPLAAKAFREGLKRHKDDPELHYGLARAYRDGDRSVLVESLDAALRLNERHVPSLLLLVDHRIDAEEYADAAKLLSEIEAVNPWHPDAWSYRAVLAHLKFDLAAEGAARTNALKFWPTNPRVDHLIGLKLSQKYRFAEGAAHQRQALAFDPEYLPAKAQLATDLLRLGEETEGWALAAEVQERDGYDVSAYNLVTLHDTLRKYTTLTNAHFTVRLLPSEAAVYGPRVLELLEQARTRLSAKYGLEPQAPTIVEIFAEQKDFGVRTFGMPDNPGFLGVCFGRVVTANGPGATRGHGANWEAVLWHEYTHVVTLQMTANRMPRWLSEGISVYEELQANPSWGQRLNPRYRSMILDGELTPVGKLSGAFLAPKTPLHLQFAYFEAYQVVDYLIRQHGIEALKGVLHDLRDGVEINAALAKRTVPLPELEKGFAEFAKAQARGMAPALQWDKPPTATGADAPQVLAKWTAANPSNFWALRQTAQRAIAEKNWAAARGPLQTLVRLYPTQTGADSAWPQLALVHRSLGETNEERQVLGEYASRDHEASETYLRLMELAASVRDWPEVRRNAERFLAVNPLVAPPYRYLADASEATGNPAAAVGAYRTLLRLDPPNPADARYQLARLLRPTDPAESRLQVLQALEESPRHRPALRLLLELQPPAPAPAPATPPAPGSPPPAPTNPPPGSGPVPAPLPK